MSETPVRVRFAPSPTGKLHVGGARTAIYNWAFARANHGTFILRIDDTDPTRSTEENTQIILRAMRWLGLDWDEGPEVGGDFGPYFQTERAEMYRAAAQRLWDEGKAYPCFCTPDQLAADRAEAQARKDPFQGYQRRCRDLDPEEARARIAAGEPYVLRIKVPEDRGDVVVRDAVHGDVTFAARELDDFVIQRTDGTPTYNFATVVDDAAMGITHVIRGEDHLSNTSKHIELYKAFGVEPPKFAHIPLILKTEGSGKMSKRDRGALIEEYQSRHFLPAAVRNYLCLLGWTPKDGREILPIEDIIAQFDLRDVHQANARFDERKMAFFNQEYLRALPDESFAWLAAPVLGEAKVIDEKTDEDYLQKVLALCKPKMNALETLPTFVGYFFREDFPIDEKGLAKLRKKSDPAARCRELVPALEAAPDVAPTTIDALFEKLGAEHGVKPTDYFAPLRFAVSGQPGGPGLHEMLELIGKERTLSRVKSFIGKISA